MLRNYGWGSTTRPHTTRAIPCCPPSSSGAGITAEIAVDGNPCISHLPSELTTVFLGFLDPVSLAAAESTCRSWKQTVDELWGRFKDFPALAPLMFQERKDMSTKHRSIRAQRAHDGTGPGTLLILGGTRHRPVPTHTYFGVVDDSSKFTETKFLSQVQMPVHLCAFGCAPAVDGGVCIVGGWGGDVALDETMFMNPKSLQCYRGPRLRTARCFLSACTMSDGTVVATGGASSLWQSATVESTIEILKPNASDTSDTSAWVWMEGPSMNYARAGHGTVAHPDGGIYVYGGYGGDMNYRTCAERFDPVIGVWEDIAPMTSRRTGIGATLGVDFCLYAIGGSPNGHTGFNTAERYDPRVGKWEWLPILEEKRGYCAAAQGAMQEVYVSGGVSSETFAKGIEVFDIRAHRWSTLPESNVRAIKRADHGMIFLL